MNVVCLVGRLIADPELRQTPQGTPVCSFTISVQKPNAKKNENGFYESDLIRCVAWRSTGEFVARYFRKGSNIGLNGSIQVNQYTDKDGKRVSSYEVLTNNVYFVESKSNTSTSESTYTQPAPKAQDNFPQNTFSSGDVSGFSTIAPDDGDLPF